MGAGREGPPGVQVGEGRATPSPADVDKVLNKPPITNTPSITQPRHGDALAAMRRRRRASRRLPPLPPCSCIRDPLTDRHRCDGISRKQIDAAAQAAEWLLELGFIPLLELEILQALYQRGGADRDLAQRLLATAGSEIR